jgi:hypothetical protein
MDLEAILTEVAAGRLSVPEAAGRIREGMAATMAPAAAAPPPSSSRGGLLGILVFLIVGLVCLGLGIFFAVRTWSFAEGAEHVDGSVTGLRYDNKGLAAPVIQYHVEGKTYEIHGTSYSRPPAYSVGQIVKVMYHPDRPSDGQLDSFLERWLPTLVLTLFGLVFTAIGVGVLFWKGPVQPAAVDPRAGPSFT